MSDHKNTVDTRYTQDRELSWLRFDQRVIEEAADESVPLFERLKFISIFTSNLDEFFMIRVGSIYDMTFSKRSHVDTKSGLTPKEQLKAIFKAVRPLYRQRDALFAQVEELLQPYGVCRLTIEELSPKDRRAVERWFRDYLTPVLSPQVVDSRHPFPHLPSKSLNIVLTLKRDGETCFGLIPIPRALPPFLLLDGMRYLLTEQVVLTWAHKLFSSYQVLDRAVISVTRNADISPEDEDYEVGEDFRQHMKKVLKKRARLAPVRLEIQGECSAALVSYLCGRLELGADQVFHTEAPIALGYVYALEAKLSPAESAQLCYPVHTPRWPLGLVKGEPLIPQILRRDVLMYYPYHAMTPFLHLIREAANDPDVLSIKITIYRLASKAKLVEYLAAAAENGKEVTVLMELRARFDEQNNIAWAERLEEAGCTVLYGAENYKVHSKICLITRRERGHIQYITQIGTGNYNEKTAKLYTDLCLMTASPAIGLDAAAFFQNMSTSTLSGEYQHLLVAPFGLKNRLMDLIDGEIEKARQGKPCRIFLKVNSVTDRNLIDKLAQASQAGVEITMNVRGICCLRPGIPGLTDRIRVFSIVGRFLEHARIYSFGVGEEARVYLGSADFMTRNTERRVEVACPVLDPDIRRQLRHYVELLCSDNVKARAMGPDGQYAPVPQTGPRLDAQQALMEEAVQEESSALLPPPKEHPAPRGRLLSNLLRRLRGTP